MNSFIPPSGFRPQTPEDWTHRIWDAMEVFSPGTPLDDVNMLAGRKKQLDRLVDIVMQKGHHAIIFGERGVGKSSLANTFSTKLLGGIRTLSFITVNCDPSDDYSSIWRKVFRRLSRDDKPVSDAYPNEIYPDDILREVAEFSLNTIPIIILDEFNELRDRSARNLTAHTIKTLSDRNARATIIVVGVADNVGDLIDENESVMRCLKQIPMHRMFPSELREIISSRLPTLGMDIQPEAMAHLVALSRGLPHYTHLFGQQAAKKTLEAQQLIIEPEHVEAALPACIADTDQSVREQYHAATLSPRQDNLYKEVLLAAALASVDDLGYFAPSALQKSLSEILERPAKVSLFGQHLKNLCDPDHGKILEQTGTDRKYRYRFSEPMMQPFILMNGLRSKLITRQQVDELAASYYEPGLSIEF
ncbi:MAG TPA: AAA family ATPase [Stellaceae bacterium]|nr:AAA family ATPase [Stellaceae bacterium]